MYQNLSYRKQAEGSDIVAQILYAGEDKTEPEAKDTFLQSLEKKKKLFTSVS